MGLPETMYWRGATAVLAVSHYFYSTEGEPALKCGLDAAWADIHMGVRWMEGEEVLIEDELVGGWSYGAHASLPETMGELNLALEEE